MVFFSVRLRQLRESKHLTQSQLAQRVGVTRSMISAYETDIRLPSYDVLIALASALGSNTDYLLCADGKRMVDISCLSDREAAAVLELVQVFTENQRKNVREAV